MASGKNRTGGRGCSAQLLLLALSHRLQTPELSQQNWPHGLSPPHQPKRLAWPGLTRHETLQETALRSKLSQLIEVTSWLVQIEQMLLLPVLQQHPLSFHPKDSIEFRNICSCMALRREGQQFERNLHEYHQCLKTIIEKLICSLAVVPSDSYTLIRSALRQILQNLLGNVKQQGSLAKEQAKQMSCNRSIKTRDNWKGESWRFY
ncbi:leukemia-associated protein 7 [Cuculus canorus]|uniref:leukemia-associated protein 7 n=1 Tax=Cuculus canorus TaxID=55661 RepID=UPI0023AB3E35|nr:leukemia-associated protein 7 [Cuculus canorus]